MDWGDVAAVGKFDEAVGEELEEDHGGVLVDLTIAEEAIDEVGNFSQGLAGKHEGVDDALKCGGDDGGGNAFSADVGDGEAKAIVESDGGVEVSADGEAGDGSGLKVGVSKTGQIDGHEAGMNAGGDGEFFSGEAGFHLGFGEQSVVKKRRGFGGDGIENLVIDFCEVTGAKLAVEIEQAKEAAGLVRRDAFAQWDAIDGADGVGHDAGPGACAAGVAAEGVGDGELGLALDGLAHGAARDGGVFSDGGAIGAEAEGEAHVVAFTAFAQEDEPALDAGELNGKLKQGVEDFRGAAAGVELAGSVEKEAELLHFAGGGSDGHGRADKDARRKVR